MEGPRSAIKYIYFKKPTTKHLVPGTAFEDAPPSRVTFSTALL